MSSFFNELKKIKFRKQHNLLFVNNYKLIKMSRLYLTLKTFQNFTKYIHGKLVWFYNCTISTNC